MNDHLPMERGVHSVYYAYLEWVFISCVSVLLSLLVLMVGMWDLIVLVPDYCLHFYFDLAPAKKKKKMNLNLI